MNAGPAEEPEKSAEVTPQMRKVLDFIKANGQITEKEIGSILGLKKRVRLPSRNRCAISD